MYLCSMFSRTIQKELEAWYARPDRKPLMLRGARQVGKTTAVRMFAQQCRHFIEINLDRPDHHAFYKDFLTMEDWFRGLFLLHEVPWADRSNTLVFIDEIQSAPTAIHGLRYLKELLPEVPVIAAGSALEFVLKELSAAPVGRVEMLVLRPLNFREFLTATGKGSLATALDSIASSNALYRLLQQAFQSYLKVGGMPELVVNAGDSARVATLASDLIASYHDDLARYATPKTTSALRELLMASFQRGGERIQFEGFIDRHAKRDVVRNGLKVLEDGRVIELVYPTSDVQLPLIPNPNRRPRLHPVDFGLMGHLIGMSGAGGHDSHRGAIAELVVGQELLAASFSPLNRLHFWTREKARAQAEVDYLLPVAGRVIPIEVKSGAVGRLRSLHQFMERSDAPFAIRVGDLPYSEEVVSFSDQTPYRLYNLPLHLAGEIPRLAASWVTESD